MRIKSIFKKSSFLIIVLSGMLFGSGIYAAVNNISQDEKTGSKSFPKNKFGETYGSIRDLSPSEKEPDLIKAIGVDGTVGYVRAADFFGEEPKSPEEALAQQTEKSVKEIKLYESDGRTVIGKFEIHPAVSSYDGEYPNKKNKE